MFKAAGRRACLVGFIISVFILVSFEHTGTHAVAYRRAVAGKNGELDEFLTFVVEEILPRVEREIPQLIERGTACEVSAGDLNHVHLCYPRELPFSATRIDLEQIEDPSLYYLLYHAFENRPLLEKQWLAELRSIEDRTLQQWLSVLEKHRFDYQRFVYTGGRPSSPPPPLTSTQLEYFSTLWRQRLASTSRQPIDSERLQARLILLSGPGEPLYYQAAATLSANRTCVTTEYHGTSKLQTTDKNIAEGHWYPLTLYFAPKAEHREATTTLEAAKGRGLPYVLSPRARGLLGTDVDRQLLHQKYLRRLERVPVRSLSQTAKGVGSRERGRPTVFAQVLPSPRSYFAIVAGSDYLFAFALKV